MPPKAASKVSLATQLPREELSWKSKLTSGSVGLDAGGDEAGRVKRDSTGAGGSNMGAFITAHKVGRCKLNPVEGLKPTLKGSGFSS
jgi:hypothetical protein